MLWVKNIILNLKHLAKEIVINMWRLSMKIKKKKQENFAITEKSNMEFIKGQSYMLIKSYLQDFWMHYVSNL